MALLRPSRKSHRYAATTYARQDRRNRRIPAKWNGEMVNLGAARRRARGAAVDLNPAFPTNPRSRPGNPPPRPETRRRANRRFPLRPSIPQVVRRNSRRPRSAAKTDSDQVETRHGTARKPKRSRSTPQQDLERRPIRSHPRRSREFSQIHPKFKRNPKRGILLIGTSWGQIAFILCQTDA